jgi:CDP-paratose 2-epimerase
LAWFAISAVRGNPITIYGNGKQVRDVLWVDDLVDLYERAVDRIDVAAGQIYNAGGGPQNAICLLDALDMLRQVTGAGIHPNFKDWRPGDQKIYISDCQRAREDFGWSPAVAPHEGVKRLARWVADHACIGNELRHAPVLLSPA